MIELRPRADEGGGAAATWIWREASGMADFGGKFHQRDLAGFTSGKPQLVPLIMAEEQREKIDFPPRRPGRME